MILRRVIIHVRQQQWTAVAIDFLIVVVGVYIGIQAQTWNAERENRKSERQYLQNLHDQISIMIEENESRVARFNDRVKMLDEVAKYLDTNAETPRLETRHCDAVIGSHIYVGRISVPPTIEELISSGRLQVIRDSAVRLAIVSYSQTIEGFRQLNADIQSDRLALSRLYPTMIQLAIQDDSIASCDFEKMRGSTAFLNDFADNRARYNAYTRDVVVGQQDLRKDLHLELDRELGISHSADSTDEYGMND